MEGTNKWEKVISTFISTTQRSSKQYYKEFVKDMTTNPGK